ncbi:hypothetical protein Cgig2_000988 [Carnegiea gigantea]|uniref:tRNA-uridine aminocarboxypropyltransferase n=1 Tax=Carnegiea gigantea TaxID=171969 RepID=A0A9Q1H089_9CARY|nr:hypothetical protein Cgig2_000988 [Carnegiea gigantea]
MEPSTPRIRSSSNGYLTFFSRWSSISNSLSPPGRQQTRPPIDGTITLQEWQGWGTTSPVPAVVIDAIGYLKALQRETDALMSFGGNGGRLMGEFKMEEDKKHRAAYKALSESEMKFQFFSARQIACRLLGSRGYLCQKCWLALGDCMCSKVKQCPLWRRIHFWVYMHPKDFLRQNNTGKLLWQVFGVQAATLCLFGIVEREDIMWNEFKKAGSSKVWCLYPNKSGEPKSVQDYFSKDVSRTTDRAKVVWGSDEISCVSVATGASVMHKLRPQPSWDRTCTAAAAAGLLSDLQVLPQFSSYCLDKQAEAVEDALDALLEALTTRRVRMGRFPILPKWDLWQLHIVFYCDGIVLVLAAKLTNLKIQLLIFSMFDHLLAGTVDNYSHCQLLIVLRGILCT